MLLVLILSALFPIIQTSSYTNSGSSIKNRSSSFPQGAPIDDVLFQVQQILFDQSATWTMRFSSNYSSKCRGPMVKPNNFIRSLSNYSDDELERFETLRIAAMDKYKNELAPQLNLFFRKSQINLLYLVGDERRKSLIFKVSAAYSQCSAVSKIYLSYYGGFKDQFEKEIGLSSLREKIVFVPIKYGLGHRFHFFNELSKSGFDFDDDYVINLDDDLTISCASIDDILFTINSDERLSFNNHRLLRKEESIKSRSIFTQQKRTKPKSKSGGYKKSNIKPPDDTTSHTGSYISTQQKRAKPKSKSGDYKNSSIKPRDDSTRHTYTYINIEHCYSIIALKFVRKVAVYKDCLQYSLDRGKQGVIGLTNAAIIPRLLMEYTIKIVPEVVFRDIDLMKNCEDILLNFVSAFLNNNTGVSAFIDTAKEISPSTPLSLSKSNKRYSRAWCVHWISFIFSPFQVFPTPINKKYTRRHSKRGTVHKKSNVSLFK